ncbi:hypothetical protein [Oceanospirillum beijerinckii]|uniref:hypothetical protein n=1 Tax=Oceanospirillum beijerinckii TaxID=64976 RepID=UPI000408262C|nr:hypothetical protein [Oceanospirillum beijerinckii]
MRISSPSQMFKSNKYKSVNATGTGMETPKAAPRTSGNTAETVTISRKGYEKAQEEKMETEK